jgi:hypothetical protein
MRCVALPAFRSPGRFGKVIAPGNKINDPARAQIGEQGH